MIVYVSKRLGGVSGSAKSAADVARAVLRYSEQARLVSLQPFRNEFQGVKVIRLARSGNRTDVKSRNLFIFILKLIENLTRRRWIDIGPRDLLLVNSYIYNVFSKVHGTATSVNIVRGSPDSFTPLNSPDLSLDEFANYIRCFDKLVFLSPKLRDDWLPYLNRHQETFVIPNTVPDFLGLRKLPTNPSASIKLVCIASVQHRKGQDILLAALNHLLDYEVEINFFGGIEPTYRKQFNSILDQYKNMDNVTLKLHGNVSAPFNMLAGDEIFVLPTRAEALSRSVIEAMSYGLPIVTTAVDGNVDLIGDDKNGLLVSPESPSEIARAVLRIHNSKNLREEVISNARDAYLRNYSESAYHNNWSKFLSRQLELKK